MRLRLRLRERVRVGGVLRRRDLLRLRLRLRLVLRLDRDDVCLTISAISGGGVRLLAPFVSSRLLDDGPPFLEIIKLVIFFKLRI